MLQSPRRPRSTLLCALLVLGGCEEQGDESDAAGDDDTEPSVCADDERAEPFMVDMAKTGGGHTVTIVDAMPAEPIRGDNTWTIRLVDAAGAPMEGAMVDVKPWMPDHGHGTPVEEVVTDLGGGEYEVRTINLFMAGLWQVTFAVLDPGQAEGDEADEMMFSLCIE